MHLVPVVPSEVDQFFDTFRDMPIAQKQQQFKALRDIHHEYIADLESSKGQPEPMVTPIAHSLVKGTHGASSSSTAVASNPPSGLAHWTELAGDGRNLYGRRSQGNLSLQPNPEAFLPFDHARPDHKWLMLPALNASVHALDSQVADVAYRTATSSCIEELPVKLLSCSYINHHHDQS